MLSPLLRLTFLLALVVGAVLGIRDGLRQRVLLTEHRRLQQLVGELPVEDQDKDKIHLVAIRTDDPLYFVWRVYLPAEQTYHWLSESAPVSSWGSWTQESQDPEPLFIRCRVRQTDDGFAMFMSRPGGTSDASFERREIGKLITRPSEQLRVEQLACDGPVVIGSDELATLLRIELADETREEIRGQVPDWLRKQVDEPLLVSRFGMDAAFAETGWPSSEGP